MQKQQVNEIMLLITGAYQNFEPTKERVKTWRMMLEDMEYELAVKRIKQHILTSKFPPTIAEIINPDEAAKRKQKNDPDTQSPAALMNGGYILM